MRKQFKNRALYIHETTALGIGDTDAYVAAFAEHYQPAMQRLGARLFGHWQGSPFNSHWPEITTIWEIDDYAHLGRLGAERAGGGSEGAAFAAWNKALQALEATGEGRLCYANSSIKLLSELVAERFDASVVIQEIMTTKPGRQEDYIEQLQYAYVPWSERTGKKWLGSFVPIFRNEEVIHYWALEGGWEGFGKWYPAWQGDIPDDIKSWMKLAPALREGWDDSFLSALPGHPLTGSE
ncbi:NIPSNAP family protein [Mangrovimicrobium sediminis]|uniref:NIPSNAP family protein n=1 Tax=Mangrovimicrobium sediminis TaxID=2562682 RepID=A0A4Z0LVM5_9GAMM|nr:NIPSNAP family protein [Haliea sp. SAOS-164]TGD71284.1 NIPSNAP family protein [Haliea sp. SAOS-164]